MGDSLDDLVSYAEKVRRFVETPTEVRLDREGDVYTATILVADLYGNLRDCQLEVKVADGYGHVAFNKIPAKRLEAPDIGDPDHLFLGFHQDVLVHVDEIYRKSKLRPESEAIVAPIPESCQPAEELVPEVVAVAPPVAPPVNPVSVDPAAVAPGSIIRPPSTALEPSGSLDDVVGRLPSPAMERSLAGQPDYYHPLAVSLRRRLEDEGYLRDGKIVLRGQTNDREHFWTYSNTAYFTERSVSTLRNLAERLSLNVFNRSIFAYGLTVANALKLKLLPTKKGPAHLNYSELETVFGMERGEFRKVAGAHFVTGADTAEIKRNQQIIYSQIFDLALSLDAEDTRIDTITTPPVSLLEGIVAVSEELDIEITEKQLTSLEDSLRSRLVNEGYIKDGRIHLGKKSWARDDFLDFGLAANLIGKTRNAISQYAKSHNLRVFSGIDIGITVEKTLLYCFTPKYRSGHHAFGGHELSELYGVDASQLPLGLIKKTEEEAHYDLQKRQRDTFFRVFNRVMDGLDAAVSEEIPNTAVEEQVDLAQYQDDFNRIYFNLALGTSIQGNAITIGDYSVKYDHGIPRGKARDLLDGKLSVKDAETIDPFTVLVLVSEPYPEIADNLSGNGTYDTLARNWASMMADKEQRTAFMEGLGYLSIPDFRTALSERGFSPMKVQKDFGGWVKEYAVLGMMPRGAIDKIASS
ncbi:hypothetical protein COV20_01145 [Candidatus Woesearchaeota archaeon CG10_big_fil_rev_8_21_14_0_10_45_16]|nr:MAG: hypothetical protein COV20_01145 [Candidatus Woesearchaeota archaeon CG10_big_fil_rev_8_21_14_0_10_45_16]